MVTALQQFHSTCDMVRAAGVAKWSDLNQLSALGIPITQWLSEDYGILPADVPTAVALAQVDAERLFKVILDHVEAVGFVLSEPAPGSRPQRPSTAAIRDMIARIEEVLADKTPACPGEWCAFADVTGAPVVLDLTCGTWPDNVCNTRRRFTLTLIDAQAHPWPGWLRAQDFTCTRTAEHTGRHAAGSGTFVVAVWGDRS